MNKIEAMLRQFTKNILLNITFLMKILSCSVDSEAIE